MPEEQVPDPSLEHTPRILRRLGDRLKHGLSEGEVRDIRAHVGADHPRLGASGPDLGAGPVPAWFGVAPAGRLAIGLLTLALLAALASIVLGARTGILSGLAAVLAVAHSALAAWVTRRSRRDGATLAARTVARATVLRGGRPRRVAAYEVVPGDILLIRTGDVVAADARVLETDDLAVDESALTGDPEPAAKDPEVLPRPVPLWRRSNMLFAGTVVVRGTGTAVVTATGAATEMAKQIAFARSAGSQSAASQRAGAPPADAQPAAGGSAPSTPSTPPAPSRLELASDRLGKIVAVLCLAAGLVVIAVLLRQSAAGSLVPSGPGGVAEVFLTGATVALVGLGVAPRVLSQALTLARARELSDGGVTVGHLGALSDLGEVDVVCTESTGVLTTGEMTVRHILTASGRTTLSGTGWTPEGGYEIDGEKWKTLHEAQRLLVRGGLATTATLIDSTIANTMDITDERLAHADPLDTALLVAQHKVESVVDRAAAYDRLGILPFDPDRGFMAVVTGVQGAHTHLVVKGAPDVLLRRCLHEQLDDGVIDLTVARREEILISVDELSAEGFHVLAVAWRDARETDMEYLTEEVAAELVFTGIVAILDPVRSDSARSIAQAREQGVRTVLVTADPPLAAARLAGELGNDLGDGVEGENAVLDGERLDGLSSADLGRLLTRSSVVARVRPERRVAIVRALQADGRVVAVTGRRLVDANALEAADVGLAMGDTDEATLARADVRIGSPTYARAVLALRQADQVGGGFARVGAAIAGLPIAVALTAVVGALWGLLPTDDALPACAGLLWAGMVVVPALATLLVVDPGRDPDTARVLPPGSPVLDAAAVLTTVVTTLSAVGAALLAGDLLGPGGLPAPLPPLTTPDGTSPEATALSALDVLAVLVLCLVVTAVTARMRSADRPARATGLVLAALAVLHVGLVLMPVVLALVAGSMAGHLTGIVAPLLAALVSLGAVLCHALVCAAVCAMTSALSRIRARHS